MSSHPSSLTSHLAALLAQRQTDLLRIIRAQGNGASGLDGSGGEVIDFKDLAADESLAAVEDARASHAAIEISEVRAALQRLNDESYWYCQECGEPIDERRLLALPTTRFCAACQASHERGSTSPGSG